MKSLDSLIKTLEEDLISIDYNPIRQWGVKVRNGDGAEWFGITNPDLYEALEKAIKERNEKTRISL